MSLVEWLATPLLLGGAVLFLTGTVGLVRFPDALSRLHALTKADNGGLLLICAGLALLGESVRSAGLLLVIWLLAMLASTVSAHLIARRALADRQSDDQSDGQSELGSAETGSGDAITADDGAGTEAGA